MTDLFWLLIPEDVSPRNTEVLVLEQDTKNLTDDYYLCIDLSNLIIKSKDKLIRWYISIGLLDIILLIYYSIRLFSRKTAYSFSLFRYLFGLNFKSFQRILNLYSLAISNIFISIHFIFHLVMIFLIHLLLTIHFLFVFLIIFIIFCSNLIIY